MDEKYLVACSVFMKSIDEDSDETIGHETYSGDSATLPERRPHIEPAPGSPTQAPSEICSDPEKLAPSQLEVQLYTLAGTEYTVWLDRDATMGQLVKKLMPQLPPRQQDLTNCAVVTSGTNPVPYPLRSPWVYRIMCTKPVTDMIASGAPIRFQLVWSATPVALIPSPQIQRFLRDKTDGSKHDAKKVGNPTWKGV